MFFNVLQNESGSYFAVTFGNYAILASEKEQIIDY
jgi:hypothetical protein